MAGAAFGDVAVTLFVAGAIFGDVAVSLFVAGTIFGDVAVAGAVYGEILIDSRSATCCTFPPRRTGGFSFAISCSDHGRIGRAL